LRKLSARTVRAGVRTPPQPPFEAGVEAVQYGDLSQPEDFGSLLADVDHVVHLAAIAHTGQGVDPQIYDRVNRLATAELAMAAAKAGVKHFVFVSSIRAQSGPSADHASTSVTSRRRPTPTAGQSSPPRRRYARPACRSRSCGIDICIISIAQQASPNCIHMSEPVRAQAMRLSAAATRNPLSASSPLRLVKTDRRRHPAFRCALPIPGAE
jgi:hypothetical protein